MIRIEEITTEQHEIHQKLILKGLIEDEECFRITPEDASLEPFPTIDQPDSFTMGAFHKDSLVGIASFKRDGLIRKKLRHKGILFKIYVHPDYRQIGIAKKLIQEVINRVSQIKDIEQINLTVIPTNKHAKAIYENFGFKTYASEEKAIKWKGKYFSEDQMKLILND